MTIASISLSNSQNMPLIKSGMSQELLWIKRLTMASIRVERRGGEITTSMMRYASHLSHQKLMEDLSPNIQEMLS